MLAFHRTHKKKPKKHPDSHQAGAMSLTDCCASSMSFVLTNFYSVSLFLALLWPVCEAARLEKHELSTA